MSLVPVGPDSAGWRKARRSMANGNCVEVCPVTGAIAVRDSKNPDGLVLSYSVQSWHEFTIAARLGQFDTRQ